MEKTTKEMTFHALVMSQSVKLFRQSRAEDVTVSTLGAVNLTDDMSGIQIASLGSDLCQCGGTLVSR